mmetsp:Transcript_17852/g.49448  ORF Transcript_17852/g.49448 Transcript_17852/m.49448 type:complete len:342 (+) Transcript_17852:304-1329(+)
MTVRDVHGEGRMQDEPRAEREPRGGIMEVDGDAMLQKQNNTFAIPSLFTLQQQHSAIGHDTILINVDGEDVRNVSPRVSIDAPPNPDFDIDVEHAWHQKNLVCSLADAPRIKAHHINQALHQVIWGVHRTFFCRLMIEIPAFFRRCSDSASGFLTNPRNTSPSFESKGSICTTMHGTASPSTSSGYIWSVLRMPSSGEPCPARSTWRTMRRPCPQEAGATPPRPSSSSEPPSRCSPTPGWALAAASGSEPSPPTPTCMAWSGGKCGRRRDRTQTHCLSSSASPRPREASCPPSTASVRRTPSSPTWPAGTGTSCPSPRWTGFGRTWCDGFLKSVEKLNSAA